MSSTKCSSNGFRFILNFPSEPDVLKANEELMLLMFEVEKAWWFYIDLVRPSDTRLPNLNLRAFAGKLFSHCALLQVYAPKFDTIFTNWQNYKRKIPTLGACILSTNLDKVLLVKGFKGSSWGWPKGKVNKDEPDAVCAAREVYEEIGFDISPVLSEHSWIFTTVGGQKMKLYIIPGVDESTPFQTQTRQEISEIAWHPIKDVATYAACPAGKNKYWAVLQVLGKLKSFIIDQKRSLSRSRTPKREKVQAAAKPEKLLEENDKEQRGKKSRGDPQRLKATEVDAAGVGRNNEETFGDMFKSTAQKGFTCEEMFRVNEEKFGMVSTYSFEQYTTKLPGKKGTETGKRGMMYADRYRPCKIQDVQMEMLEARDDEGVAAPVQNSLPAPQINPSAGLLTPAMLTFAFNKDAIVGEMNF